jgi:hypothetical protein
MKLDEYCYTHRFWLPFCYHDQSVKLTVCEEEGQDPSAVLHCSREVGLRCEYEGKCQQPCLSPRGSDHKPVDLLLLVESQTLVCSHYGERRGSSNIVSSLDLRTEFYWKPEHEGSDTSDTSLRSFIVTDSDVDSDDGATTPSLESDSDVSSDWSAASSTDSSGVDTSEGSTDSADVIDSPEVAGETFPASLADMTNHSFARPLVRLPLGTSRFFS